MKNPSSLPVIGITMGDPVGIGPEILVKALNNPELYSVCRPIILGDFQVIKQALDLLNCSFQINSVTTAQQGCYQFKTIDLMELSHLNLNCSTLLRPTIATGTAMQDYIIKGINFALNKQIDGLVTCPITKTAMKLAGSQFHGHTELLADQTKTKNFSMMLAGDTLKVVLVTIHIPLSKVAKNLKVSKILQTIQLTHNGLIKRFNIHSPKIGVAGLNPHSGEDSMFGNEEKIIIEPAVLRANKKGMNVTGPLPPDTIFYQAINGKFDAVVCMYHDQGLIPFKLIHFKDGVNTTLGLPIIRTSVDHGTAYDIAWKGIADQTSLEQAIKMAAFQAQNQKLNQ